MTRRQNPQATSKNNTRRRLAYIRKKQARGLAGAPETYCTRGLGHNVGQNSKFANSFIKSDTFGLHSRNVKRLRDGLARKGGSIDLHAPRDSISRKGKSLTSIPLA